MDSNYQWQKQRADERVASRLQEAEVARRLQEGKPRRRSWVSLVLARIGSFLRHTTQRRTAEHTEPRYRKRPSG